MGAAVLRLNHSPNSLPVLLLWFKTKSILRLDYDLPVCPYEPQPRWYVQKKFPNTYLICSKEDFRKSTYLVKQAELLKVVNHSLLFSVCEKSNLLEFRFAGSRFEEEIYIQMH